MVLLRQTPVDEEANADRALEQIRLIERSKSGDRSAVATLLEAHYDFIRRMLYRLVGPTPDLDDLEQTVLLNVVAGLPRFRGESALSTWIGGICVHVSREHLRRQRKRSMLVPVDAVEELPEALRRQPDAEARVESRQELAAAFGALGKLSAEQRSVFVLRMLFGHSIAEIAAMTESATSTTRLRLYYARKAFTKALTRLRAPWKARRPKEDVR